MSFTGKQISMVKVDEHKVKNDQNVTEDLIEIPVRYSRNVTTDVELPNVKVVHRTSLI